MYSLSSPTHIRYDVRPSLVNATMRIMAAAPCWLLPDRTIKRARTPRLVVISEFSTTLGFRSGIDHGAVRDCQSACTSVPGAEPTNR